MGAGVETKRAGPTAGSGSASASEMMRFSVDGREQHAGGSWYRGETCNFNPDLANLAAAEAPFRHVVMGWDPPEPFIRPDSRIVAFGSCFAQHISNWLTRHQFNVLTSAAPGRGDAYVVRFGEGMVNTFVLRQQFEWAWENQAPKSELWHDHGAEAVRYDEQVRLETRALFDQADLFILTLGLSEVWYDKLTQEVFWRAVPKERFDPSRHAFRVSTVAENKQNLQAILGLIRRHRPDARVILTLSPIPLVATFRPVSCITANSASKAILRAALDEFLREAAEPGLFYWPSYELVMELFGERWKPDHRHVKPEILEFVMTLFGQVWCQGLRPKKTLLQAWIEARAATGLLPREAPDWLAAGAADEIERVVRRLQLKRPQDAKLILARLDEIRAADPASPLAALALGGD